MSMIMADGMKWPEQRWTQPDWRTHFEELLKAAKKYDDETGQNDCENDDKKKYLQDLADKLGVKINFPE
jgi:hypothetical protein